MDNRVVVTGMGLITPIGNSVDEFWKGIKQSKCGIEEITPFDNFECKARLAAQVKDFNIDDMDKKTFKRLDRYSQFAMYAAKEATKDLNMDNIDKYRVGVIVGSAIGGIGTIEKEHTKLLTYGGDKVSPFLIPSVTANMATSNIAISIGAKGYSLSVLSACASGNHSIGEAFRIIKHGYQDIVLCGGSEACISPLPISGFINMKALYCGEDKLRASIPFDKARDGFVIGEGAGIVVLENLEHARKRNAKIYAEVVGYGATSDAYSIVAPEPSGEGIAVAIKDAIYEANISYRDIDYINAHGTSTKLNDKTETIAVKKVFGDNCKVPISSIKGNTGHLLGASGAVEFICCVNAINHSYIPATIGYKEVDKECDLDYVPNVGRDKEINYVISNSFGFGGHNSCIVLKKYDD